MVETLAVASKTLIDVRDLKMHFPLTQGIILQRVMVMCAQWMASVSASSAGRLWALWVKVAPGKPLLAAPLCGCTNLPPGKFCLATRIWQQWKARIAPGAPARADDLPGPLCLAQSALYDWLAHRRANAYL